MNCGVTQSDSDTAAAGGVTTFSSPPLQDTDDRLHFHDFVSSLSAY